MEVTYTMPDPIWLWVIGVWLLTGVVGTVAMAVADRRAERLWGLEPYVVRPDYILAGPLSLIMGVVQFFIVVRAGRRDRPSS